MIYLESETVKLQAVLGAAVAANQPEASVFFFDHIPQATTTLRRGAPQYSTLNGTTDVDICAAPALHGIVRNIHTIFINNKDTATVTVTIKRDDGGTESIYVKQAIAPGESLVYEDGAGWQVLSPITPPFVDSTELLKGSSDATKKVRFEVDGLTTATTRVITVPDSDVTLLTTATQAQQETGSITTAAVTPGRQQFHQSALKMWANINFGGDATPELVTGFNVTSVTDVGVGNYEVNLTVSFSASTYPAVATSGDTTIEQVGEGTSVVTIFSRTNDAAVSVILADAQVFVMASGDQ